jgi:hypothetical protein
MRSLQQRLKISLRCVYPKARQDRNSSKNFERDNMGDAIGVTGAWVAMRMIVSIFSKASKPGFYRRI